MKKLVNGIVDFRKKKLAEYREKFAALALGQSPDTLFIACSDSRVAANAFASTDPGDLFVIRNVGNLIPVCGNKGHSTADESEAAAIEFAILNLRISDIIVCGHSDCGAMHAIIKGRENIAAPNLRAWLRHGEPALLNLAEQTDGNDKMNAPVTGDTASSNTVAAKSNAAVSESNAAVREIAVGNGPEGFAALSQVNKLSQINVLQQLDHLRSYPLVNQRILNQSLKLHGWWFDVATGNISAYEEDQGKFVVIDEEEAKRILEKLNKG